MIFHIIQLSTMNRFWMLGTLIVGSSIALLRNIHVTIDLFNHGIKQGITEGNIMFASPLDASPRLRRALQEDNSHLNYQFIYYDEESLSRERALFREEDPNVLLATNDLFDRVNEILETPLSTNSIDGLSANENTSSQVADMQRNTTLLGLAYFFTGEDEFAERATYLVRTWFLSSETKIDPKHLCNSPLRSQVHAFLDSLQMILGHLEDSEIIQLQRWFLRYLEYTGNNFVSKSSTHTSSLYFDVEQLALSNFVGDEGRQAEVFKRVLIRLSHQIKKDGSLPEELAQKEECDHSQMLALEGWWTLGRLFTNSMGETLWTAEGEAMCRATEFAVPYFRDRPKCGLSTENDQRWWPVIVDAMRYCPNLQSKPLEWRDWMSPNSREVPSSRYEMPRVYSDYSRIPPFWNLGMPVEKEATDDEPNTDPPPKDASTFIPIRLSKAAEHDPQMAQRVHRIKRWHQLGQIEIADRMTKKAIKDLQSTSSTSQNKDYIPATMLKVAKTDKAMNDRIGRIRRWHGLAQHSIVERMIKKSMDELKQKAEDDAALALESNSESEKSKSQDSQNQQKSSKPRLTSSMEIPNVFLEQAETDAEMAKRIFRIQRWKRLGQHEIANKMVKKMLASTEDQTF
mmetsp:Transcript_18331/g.27699  ORF Transcript_18331/g.27699 Transcript_18331/m.27699 type:complete len:627 (+) Transcript_18331:92-1972(+)